VDILIKLTHLCGGYSGNTTTAIPAQVDPPLAGLSYRFRSMLTPLGGEYPDKNRSMLTPLALNAEMKTGVC
jgi:hypothetical protein